MVQSTRVSSMVDLDGAAKGKERVIERRSVRSSRLMDCSSSLEVLCACAVATIQCETFRMLCIRYAGLAPLPACCVG